MEIINHEHLRQLVEEIDSEGEELTAWEIEFIASLIDNDVEEFTEKQAAIIERIHNQRVEQ